MDPEKHYYEFGESEGRMPNEYFDPKLYYKLNIPMSNTNKKINGVKKVSYNLNRDEIIYHKKLIEYSSRHYERKDIKYMETINTKYHENLTEVHIEMLKQ